MDRFDKISLVVGILILGGTALLYSQYERVWHRVVVEGTQYVPDTKDFWGKVRGKKSVIFKCEHQRFAIDDEYWWGHVQKGDTLLTTQNHDEFKYLNER